MQLIYRQAFTAIAALVIPLALLGTGPAAAGPILTFGFTELDGSFNGTNLFTAGVGSDTDGDVTRVLPVEQTALFNADFSGLTADYFMTMTLTNITAATADGTGSLIITDVDGDTITADAAGAWIRNGVFGFFNGLLENVRFNPTGDGVFEGPSGGSFSLDFSAFGPAPYEGAIMVLETGKWFTVGTPWTAQNTLIQGSVLPEPSTALLGALGLAALIAQRRRLG